MKSLRGRQDRLELHGDRLGDYLGIRARTLLKTETRGETALAVTWLSSQGGTERSRPTEPAAAFSVTFKRAPIERIELWENGRPIQDCGVAAGTAKMIDLSEASASRITGPIDSVHLYVSHAALDGIVRERGGRSLRLSRLPSNEPDPLLGHLCDFLLSTPPALETGSPLFAEQVSIGVLTYLAERYGGLQAPTGALATGRLAPWQERRAREIIHSRFGARITIADIARECHLSPGHFTKAFQRSFGRTPHRYLTEVRVTEAKSLLAGSSLPLADIALICGFGDQSYFTRVFTRTVGAGPGAWRRSGAG